MLLTESVLVLLILIAAFLVPCRRSSRWAWIEHQISTFSRRRTLAVVTVGAVALGLRAAVLPILPVPYPGVDDEFSYQLMADTFVHGRLTNPTHPMWIHFETIAVIQQPTYCSVFYPAQGLFMALGRRLVGNDFWGVWLSVGLMCAAICWMLQQWVPPYWAFIGGLLSAIRIAAFSYWANSYFGGAIAALGGALVLGALPRMKRFGRPSDAALMGVGFALLATTRPFEGFFFGLPVFLSVLFWLRRNENLTATRKFWGVIAPSSAILGITTGFMLYYFHQTTGNAFLPAYIVNVRTYFIDPAFPWLHVRPTPAYHHEILRQHYFGLGLNLYNLARTHPVVSITIKCLMLWFFFLGPLLTLPFLALGFVLPYGLSWSQVSPKTRFLLAVCLAGLLAVMLPVYANPHYAAPMTAAIYALLMMSMQRVRKWRMGQQTAGLFVVRSVLVGAVALLLLRVAVPVFHLPLGNSDRPETWCSAWYQLVPRAEVERILGQQPGRHVVFVRHAGQHTAGEGWVKNSADIDNSTIVWAHDMGSAQNAELMHYFRNRRFWLVEPDSNPVRFTPYPAAESSGASR